MTAGRETVQRRGHASAGLSPRNPRAGTTPVSTLDRRLAEELTRVLSRHFGIRLRVARLEREPFPFASTHPLERLDVALEDGTRLELLRKRTGAGAASGSRPRFLRDPRREACVYRELLAPAGLDTPIFYGTGGEGSPAGPWLLLERVSGRELYQVGETGPWEAAARWLAGFHARFEGVEPVGDTRLLYRDAGFHRRWSRRARALARLRGEPASRCRALEVLEAPLRRAADRLALLPRTVLHGEFYASNVLVEGEGGEVRVRPVDWEMAAVGPGVVDLAALTAGSWGERELGRMLYAYRAGLEAAGGCPPDETDLRRQLECARLCLAVQWLGWSAGWTPPPTQARDWLAEARAAAARLEPR